jgi:enoyl-CoA hydratase/carnithine racemase
VKVTTEVHDGVAVLTLDDGRANALDRDGCGRLVDAIEDAGSRAEALVLTGARSIFSAGGDLALLQEWHTWEPPQRSAEVAEGPHAVTRALLDAPVPTVAAVNGAAVGAGLDLALVCDLRVAATTASFCEAYVHVGVIPGDGGAWLLPRHIGMGAALDLLLTGRTVDVQEARTLGIVGRVCEPERLLDEARALARTLADRPRQAVVAIRRAVYDGAAESFDAHLRSAARLMGALGGTAEHRAAVDRIAARRS